METNLRKRVRAGDHDAFGELFDAYARSVYNHAFRLTGEWATAQDVVSLTFLDAWRLRDKVDEEGGSERPDKDYAAFVLFGDLIRESLMPPKVSAALYRAAAKIPGVEVARNVKDSVGREGIAITRQQSGGVREEQIFDAKTYTYLGEREVGGNGKVTGMSAVLERAVVDKAGRRP